MSTPHDSLEERLRSLRPGRLPVETRREILQKMDRPARRRSSLATLFGHHAGVPVALAGVLSLTLVVGWHWLSLPARDADSTRASGGTSSCFAAVTPICANAVLVLRSPAVLTNAQIRR